MPTVVIVGASADRSKFGNKAIRAHLAKGWTVIPVNPRGGEIEGLPVLTTLADVHGPVDRIVSYLPPAIGLATLEELTRLEHGELWISPGAESDELLARARELGLDPIVACTIVDVGGSPALL